MQSACASNARSSCDLTLTSDVSIGATFNAIPDPFQFTVDAPAKATVQITIDGKIQLCNGQKCTYPSAQGTKVAISVAPYVNYILESWGGSCAGVRDNVCYVTLSSNHMNVTVRVGPK